MMKNIKHSFGHSPVSTLKLKKDLLASNYIQSKIKNINIANTNIEKEYAYLLICLNDYQSQIKCTLNKCQSKINGYWNEFKIIDDKVFKTIRACQCLIKERGTWATLENVSLDTFNSKYQNYLFKDFKTPNKTLKKVKLYLQKTVKLFPKYTKPLILIGPSQSGKTFISAIIANELFTKSKNLALVNLRNSYQEMEYDKPLYFKALKNRYLDASALFILNLGEEKNKGFSRDFFLYEVIKKRIENKKPTFFTSQYSLKQLRKKYCQNNKDIEGNMLIDLIEFNFLPLMLEAFKK